MSEPPTSGCRTGGSEPSTEASTLCRGCGICCDGTMFGFVPLEAEEASRLRHRLPVLAASATLETRFEQRCVALGASGCSLYEERPTSCAEFRCKLLRRMEAGEISLDAARGVVARIHALARRLDRELPPGNSFHTRRALLAELEGRSRDEAGVALGQTWLDVSVLEVTLRRELRNDDDEPRTASEIGAPVT